MLARLRDRLPMDVVERHMKREEDLQSIEDSHESADETPPHRRRRGRRRKRAMVAHRRRPTALLLFCLIMRRPLLPQGCHQR